MEREEKRYGFPVTRRSFMQGLSAVAAAGALTGCSSDDDDDTYSHSNPNTIDLRQTRKVYSTCPVECLTHSLNCQLVGDTVIRVEPTRKPGDKFFTTACARGMSRMQFLTENRAATPMKRIRKNPARKNNAEDTFVSISWDTALAEIAEKLKPLKDDQGVIFCTGSGNMGPIANGLIGNFFAFAAPNRLSTVGNSCCQGADDGMVPVYGERGIDTRDTVKDSKCIICWGNNPAVSSNTYWKYFMEAREQGAEIIVIDPRYSVSAENSTQWLPINPGTDTLVAIGMLRHIFANDLSNGSSYDWVDEEFLKHRTDAPYLIDLASFLADDNTPVALTDPDAHNKIANLAYYELTPGSGPCVYDLNTNTVVPAEENKGTDHTPTQDPDLYRANASYVTVYQLMRALYAGDIINFNLQAGFSLPDLPALHDPTYTDDVIAGYTGVDISEINSCAEKYAGSGKKSMIIQNMGGAMRTENGGHMCALHCILSLITGNVGEKGNGVDDTSGYGSLNGYQDGDPKKIGTSATYITEAVPAGTKAGYRIPFGVLGQRVRDANKGTPQDVFLPTGTFPAGTKDPQVKFWYIATRNLLTQFPNTDALKEALLSSDTVVVAKPTWNTDADYCDYFLPVTTPFEYHDLGASNRNKYVQVMEAGVAPYGQALSDMQIMRRLAKLVLSPAEAAQFDHDDEFYVKSIVENPANNFASNGITYERLQQEKTIRPSSIPLPWVPFTKKQFLGSRATNKRAKLFVTQWQSASTYPYPRISPNPAKILYRGPFPRFVPALESQLPWAPEADKPWTSGLTWDTDFGPLPANYQDYRTKYSYNCVQMKIAMSVHASFTGLPWIREAFGEKGRIYIHAEDALALGIKNGEMVTVTSNIGSVQRVAMVTNLIKKGVTALENGWWDKFGPVSSSAVGTELPDPMGCGHTHNNTLVSITKGGR